MLNDPDDPHHSHWGCCQLTANLLAAICLSQPAVYAYVDIVHDHIMRLRFDKDHPPPRARFYQRSSAHTGIPDPPNSSGDATSSTNPNVPPCMSVRQVVHAKGLDKTTPQSYASVVAPPQTQTLAPNADVRPRDQASTLLPPTDASHPLSAPPGYNDSLFSFTDIRYRTSTTGSTTTKTDVSHPTSGPKPRTKVPLTSTTKTAQLHPVSGQTSSVQVPSAGTNQRPAPTTQRPATTNQQTAASTQKSKDPSHVPDQPTYTRVAPPSTTNNPTAAPPQRTLATSELLQQLFGQPSTPEITPELFAQLKRVMDRASPP